MKTTILTTMALCFPVAALAFESALVELGDPNGSNAQTRAYKMNVIEPSETIVLENIAPYLDLDEGVAIEFLVYEETDTATWEAMYRSGAVELGEGESFRDHAVDIEMSADVRYAIGFYIGEDPVEYFFEVYASLPDNVAAWASHSGAVWTTDGETPEMDDLIVDDLDNDTTYWMQMTFLVPSDADGDGVLETEDCDDSDPTVQEPYDYFVDDDGDGFGVGASTTTCGELPPGAASESGDCDDGNSDVYPYAPERCDGIDQDCDGTIDENPEDGVSGYVDSDGDGFGDPGNTVFSCGGQDGIVDNGDDCDDANLSVYPGAEETCNRVDDDCDGTTDEEVTTTYYVDADLDGYGDMETPVEDCSLRIGYSENGEDCDDNSAFSYPGAPDEAGDGLDQDCDGEDGYLVLDIPTADKDSSGCSTSGAAPVAGWLLLLPLLARRRS
jgi:hypothetical protein